MRLRTSPIPFCMPVVVDEYLFTVEPVSDTAIRARRCRLRIIILLAAMGLMGLCDLALTITYMQSVGMIEVNPLARYIVHAGGVPLLIIFKLALMTCSTAFLYVARGNKFAEPIAWLCAIILLGLMVHWFNYNREIPDFTNEMAILAMEGPVESFVRVGS